MNILRPAFLLALLPACGDHKIDFPSDDTDVDTDVPDTDTGDTGDTSAPTPGERFEGAFGPGDADMVLLTKNPGDAVGWEHGLATVPDLDGDGADELLVAAKNTEGAGGGWDGMAYLVSNPPPGTNFLNVARTTFVGDTTSGMFGTAVASVGDVNGDGEADLAISAAREGAGLVHVFFGPFAGGAVSAADSDAQLEGEGTGSYAGLALHGAGDVDGDGRDDVVVGSYYGPPGCSDCGTVYVSFAAGEGGASSLADDTFRVEGGGARGPINDAAVTGDFDCDGALDLLVGAPGTDTGGAGVWYGPLSAGTTTLDDADAWFTGSSRSYTGLAVAAADLDGDGCDEIVAGGPYAQDGGTNSGVVFVMPGARTRYAGTTDLLTGVVLTGDAQQYAGMHFTEPRDIDHDGNEDLLVGSSFSGAGLGWLLYGGPLTPGTYPLADAAIVFAGDEPGSMTGQAIALGDYDGDGAGDVALGTMIATPPNTGGVYVFAGP